MQEIMEWKREGLTISAISELSGHDRKTVRKYLAQPEGTPVYGRRQPRPSKLDAFKPYLEERLQAGVWNAVVLLRELRARGSEGGYTILKDWLQPQRESARVVAVRRFEALRDALPGPSSTGGLTIAGTRPPKGRAAGAAPVVTSKGYLLDRFST